MALKVKGIKTVTQVSQAICQSAGVRCHAKCDHGDIQFKEFRQTAENRQGRSTLSGRILSSAHPSVH